MALHTIINKHGLYTFNWNFFTIFLHNTMSPNNPNMKNAYQMIGRSAKLIKIYKMERRLGSQTLYKILSTRKENERSTRQFSNLTR